MISFQSDVEGNQHVKIGKLNLVDLAGSEKQSKTGAQVIFNYFISQYNNH